MKAAGLPSPGMVIRRKKLVLWPVNELQAYYDRIGKVDYQADPIERLDDVAVVQFDDDRTGVWIEVTTSQIVK